MDVTLAPSFRAYEAHVGGSTREGMRATPLPGVRFFRCARHIPCTPLVYEPGLVIIGQGYKEGHLDGHRFRYGDGNYLILSVPVPFECETFGTPEAPLLGLFVELHVSRVRALLDAMALAGPDGHPAAQRPDAVSRGVEPARLGAAMASATERLLRCLRDPMDARVLGPGIVDELVYRALLGPHGAALVSLTRQRTQYARVARALTRVHRDYARSLSVEELARESSMSESSFFRAFKQVTGHTPLQYVKKIRLDKAWNLLRHEELPVSAVAYEVGYESAAQFSREFKRHFATSPSTMRRAAESSAAS